MTCNCNRSGDCQTPPEPCPDVVMVEYSGTGDSFSCVSHPFSNDVEPCHDCARLVRGIDKAAWSLLKFAIACFFFGDVMGLLVQNDFAHIISSEIVFLSFAIGIIAIVLRIVVRNWQRKEE